MIEKEIKALLEDFFKQEIPDNLIQLQKTRKEFEGDITLVAFPLLRLSKKSPEETAYEIGDFLVGHADVISFQVEKGFLNLKLDDLFWLRKLKEISETNSFGFQSDSGQTYVVEYASPNTNKPLHLGHLRNIFLGFSVSEILKANGHKVIKTQIINDRGIHICKSMLAWQKYGKGETPESSSLKGDKLVGKYYVKFDKVFKEEVENLKIQGRTEEEAKKSAPIFLEAQEMLRKWEAKDPGVYKLWETMNQWCYDGFKVTYDTMGVDFDKNYYESNTYILGKNIVEEGLAKNIFYRKEDGSIWCAFPDKKLDDKLLLRADGTSVYMTQDIGTAVERYKDFPEMNGMVYTVGNEQDHHFKVLFEILDKLSYPFAKGCHHLSYGMVELRNSAGEVGKMKSREGTVVDADDIMESVTNDAKVMTQERGHLEGLSEENKEWLYKTIGIGGLKYYLLKVDPKKNMAFNPEESIDLNGHTAPFIQYGYARIQSILKKSTFSGEINTNILQESEKELIKALIDYPSAIKEASKNFAPSIICNYTYDLVKTFNSFYQSVPILIEDDKDILNMRLMLVEEVGKAIKSSMRLLGIEVPNQM